MFVRDFTHNRAIYKRARSAVNHNAFASSTIIISRRKNNPLSPFLFLSAQWAIIFDYYLLIMTRRGEVFHGSLDFGDQYQHGASLQ